MLSREPSVLPALVPCTQDDDADVRQAALGLLAAAAAHPALAAHLQVMTIHGPPPPAFPEQQSCMRMQTVCCPKVQVGRRPSASLQNGTQAIAKRLELRAIEHQWVAPDS